MKILGIGAHPDDIEIYMFGFLSACKKRGDDICLAVATDGRAGNLSEVKDIVNVRKKEAISGLKFLGKPFFFNFPDGELSFNNNASLLFKNHIDMIKPDLIVTHSPEDYHPDHKALSDMIVQAAGFSAPILFADTLMGVSFIPDYYIDITPYMKEKVTAISRHHSQNPKKFVEATRLLNRFRSAQCNLPKNHYAEAYRVEKKFPFVDIRSLIPNSISINHYYKSSNQSFI